MENQENNTSQVENINNNVAIEESNVENVLSVENIENTQNNIGKIFLN